jgi:hypothetical protein
MKNLNSQSWLSDLFRFSVKWESRIDEILKKENYLDFFISKHWSDFDNSFNELFPPNIISQIKTFDYTEIQHQLINLIISLKDLKSLLANSIDGGTSLTPREYFTEMFSIFKRLSTITEKYEFDKLMEDGNLSSTSENMDEDTQVEYIQEIKKEENEINIAGDEMIEEVIELNSDELKHPTSLVLPKAKKSKSYDSVLKNIDPVMSGPIISLAGKKKIKKKDESNLPHSIQYIKELIKSVEEGKAKKGELSLLDYFGKKLMEHTPHKPEDCVDSLISLDARMAILGGEEGKNKIESQKITNEISSAVFKSLDKALKTSSTTFLICSLDEIKTKDTLQGEIKLINLEFKAKKRIPNFLKGSLEFNITYLPKVVSIKVKGVGASNLPPPFYEGTAVQLFDWTGDNSIILSFTLSCLKSFISRLAI